MRIGELAEPVVKRSVLRQLQIGQAGISGEYGADASVLPGQEKAREGAVFATSGPLPGYEGKPWRQVTAAVNALAAEASDCIGVILQGELSCETEEAALREEMCRFREEASLYGSPFLRADLQVSGLAEPSRYFVTAVGARPERPPLLLKPGMELVMAREAALAGTAALAAQYETELTERYPSLMIQRAKGFDQWMSVTEAARAVNHFGPCPMHCIARGGIFHALWEMAERAGVGLEVDLRHIPVKQETIEICEYFDINPYYLYSAGALLIGTDQPGGLMAALREAEIPAAVIGRTTDKKDRVLLNGESRRYLDRPGQDAWWGRKRRKGL